MVAYLLKDLHKDIMVRNPREARLYNTLQVVLNYGVRGGLGFLASGTK